MSTTGGLVLGWTVVWILWAVFLGLPVLIWAGAMQPLAGALIAAPIGYAIIGLFRLIGGPD